MELLCPLLVDLRALIDIILKIFQTRWGLMLAYVRLPKTQYSSMQVILHTGSRLFFLCIIFFVFHYNIYFQSIFNLHLRDGFHINYAFRIHASYGQGYGHLQYPFWLNLFRCSMCGISFSYILQVNNVSTIYHVSNKDSTCGSVVKKNQNISKDNSMSFFYIEKLTHAHHTHVSGNRTRNLL